MIRKICALVAAAWLAVPVLAAADDYKLPVFIETRPVPDKPGFAINPAKAYVLLRGDMPTAMYLMRVPSEADKATYAGFRARALQVAHDRYLKKLKQYDEAMAAPPQPGIARPPKPVEPIDATFETVPYETLTAISIGPIFRFAKAKGGASTYLQEVTPGEYRLYGPITFTSAGPMGTCYCMGSVKFEAKAGEITDLGVILSKDAPVPKLPEGDSSMPLTFAPTLFLGDAPAGMTLDPRLASMPIHRATFHPVGKLPNYYGITVGRIPAMPGIIGYDRDRILDLTGTQQ